jgi:hypothetical protein
MDWGFRKRNYNTSHQPKVPRISRQATPMEDVTDVTVHSAVCNLPCAVPPGQLTL